MTLPRQHTWDCLYFGDDANCATCHPQPTCKNCGHTASEHLYSDEPATFGWCPRCRGCGPKQKEQAMKHVQIFTSDHRIHHIGIGSQQEVVAMVQRAMNEGHTLSFTSGNSNPILISGKYIVAVQVCDGPIPVQETC